MTLRRVAGPRVRYAGKVRRRAAPACRSNRLVVLRHTGSGFKRFTIARTRADGSFTLSRRTRTGGTVYAAVVEKVSGRRLCRFARSSPRPGVAGRTSQIADADADVGSPYQRDGA